jgi:hypothetical protein
MIKMRSRMKINKFAALTSLLIIGISNIAVAQQKIPFTGTRYFNFMGGSGTEQSITVEKNGVATLKHYGVVSSGVSWKGKFANPLILTDQGGLLGQKLHGLLFKNNKVYAITDDGQIIKGCKGKETLCESKLFNR